MARIPEGEIERLKREVSLERLAETRGVELKRHGADLIGLCPFHEDHSPSLVISPQKNLWNCLGACGEGGSVIDWVMRAEGISFRHAVELLRHQHLPLAASPGAKPPQRSTVPKLPAPVSREVDDSALLLQVTRYYHEALKNSPDALKYLQGRGLTSTEMIEQFQLGFASRTLGYGLPEKNRVAGAELRGRLQRLGIFRDTGHEHFNGSVVIPVFNLEGEVVQMYGRKITPGLRPGTPLHLYLPGPHRGVWNEQALIASKEIILCEALIDALTFWCAGYRHATASYGVNGFTDDHRAAFQKHGTKRIYIAYDRDDAGERAAGKLAEELMATGIECFRVQFPKGMDANEYARKVTPAPKSLGMLLGKAAWLGKGARPTVAVSEPVIETPSAIEGKIEPTAKEKSMLPAVATEAEEPTAAATEEESAPTAKEKIPETIEATGSEEAVFPLAAQPPIAALPTGSAVPVRDAPVESRGETVYVSLGERRYRIVGLPKNTAPGVLQVNVMVTSTSTRGETRLHVDKLDLYAARLRAIFAKQAAKELGHKEESIERDLNTLILKLEDLQHEWIEKTLKPPEEKIEMTEEEKAAALELLRDPRLLDRILEDFEKYGVVGEQTNKKVTYLAAVSRLLPKPLAVVVQSVSAAGKSSLVEAVLDFMPEEQREEYSAMTGQALYYMGQKNLKHKILAIAEQQGAERAAYALKLLQSEGVLKIASTGKDPVSGKHVTHEYLVEGPVSLFLTTTSHDVDEELMNRCLVLTVNEEQEQTRAIHKKQREAQTVEGMWAQDDREEILRVHRNAQRLLRPLRVVIPKATQLTYPDSMTRTRRDHAKFLTLINAIALLHQHQREMRTSERKGKTLEYIEATEADVKLAWELVNEVLTPSLEELPAQTRKLVTLLDAMAQEHCQRLGIERGEYRFTRATVRQHTHWGDTQLRVHLRRLEEMEYLVLRRGGGQGQLYVYQMRFMLNADGQPVLLGLSDFPGEHFAGVEGQFAGSSRPLSGGIAGGARGEESSMLAQRNGDPRLNLEKNTYREGGAENRIVAAASHSAKPNGSAAGAK
jgi:DNA primase catalytic core